MSKTKDYLYDEENNITPDCDCEEIIFDEDEYAKTNAQKPLNKKGEEKMKKILEHPEIKKYLDNPKLLERDNQNILHYDYCVHKNEKYITLSRITDSDANDFIADIKKSELASQEVHVVYFLYYVIIFDKNENSKAIFYDEDSYEATNKFIELLTIEI